MRVMGKPLPQIYRNETENLFPNFTTVYAPVDEEFWFPVKTVADDVLRQAFQPVPPFGNF